MLSLSAVGEAVFSSCWWFGLRCPSTGAYRLLGGTVWMRKWWPSGGLNPVKYFSELPPPQPLPASAGDPPKLAGMSGPGFYEVTAFSPWILVCLRPSVCHPGVEFLFPPIPWKPCCPTLLAFKARFACVSSSHCQAIRLENLTWGSEFLLPWENFCGAILFQFVGCPPSSFGNLIVM